MSNLDRLQKSMVKILRDKDKEDTVGSGFIIREDGHLVTCHHVIYQLDSLWVEYQGNKYQAQWCEEYSHPDVDIAILKIDIGNAQAVKIINPPELATSIIVYGFPATKARNFPEGFDVVAKDIIPSAPLNVLSTYPSREVKFTNPWNKLPSEKATFKSHRLKVKVERGTSGGAVFAQDLGGVVGVIQCSKSDESYVIRWDNILETLDKLGLNPEKNAVCRFLEAIEARFKYLKLFHIRQQIALKDQYIPIEVTLERRYKHEVETTLAYQEEEAELRRIYALKGWDEERQKEEIKKVQVDWKEAKKEHQRMMILGDPGMGKSTLLRMEAVTVTREELENLGGYPPQPPFERGENIQPLLKKGKNINDVVFPLLIRLSELAEAEGELIDIIPQIIARDYPQELKEVDNILRDKLAEGKCLLLLDALDEVPKEKREKLKEKLQRLARQSANKIYLTSRIVGYGGNFLSDAKEVEIVPFSQPQIEHYIETWFVNAAEYLTDDSVSAGGLIEELQQKPQINGLAQNPLLLSLICSLYQEQELVLPAKRCQLYETAVNYMLKQWRTQHSQQQPDEGWLDAKLELLEWLAYRMSCEGKEVISPRDLSKTIDKFFKNDCGSDFQSKTASVVIQELAEEDGIIQKFHETGDKYIFLHRTFQEYLTACYLSRASNKIELARQHLWNYEWHEILSLLAGLLDNPMPFLQALISEKDDVFHSLLLLAGRCLTECGNKYHKKMTKIINEIYEFWQSYPSLLFIQSVTIALGQVNVQMFEKLQVALQDKSSDINVRQQAAEVLGKIANFKAVTVLIQACKDEDKGVRFKAEAALERIGNSLTGSKKLIQALCHHSNSTYVRKKAAEVLGRIGSHLAEQPLIDALKDDPDGSVRSVAAQALGQINSHLAEKPLIDALKDDPDGSVRSSAAQALGQIDSHLAERPLIWALRNDGNKAVRINSALTLGKIGSSRSVVSLIQALNDSHSDFELASVQWALREIGDSQAINALVAGLQNMTRPSYYLDNNLTYSNYSAAYLNSYLNSFNTIIEGSTNSQSLDQLEQSIESCLQSFKDPDIFIRQKSIDNFIKVFKEIKKCNQENKERKSKILKKVNAEAFESITQLLEDRSRYIKESAIKALIEIGNSKAAMPLIKVLNDPNIDLKQKAIEALAEISSKVNLQIKMEIIIALLFQTTQNSKNDVQKKINSVLEKIKQDYLFSHSLASIKKDSEDQYKIKKIKEELKNKDPKVREESIEKLREFKNSLRPLEPLINIFLTDDDKNVKNKALDLLFQVCGSSLTLELIEELNNEDWRIRQNAVDKLSKFTEEQTIIQLTKALQDGDWRVRKKAVEVLGEKAVEVLR